MEAEHSPSVDRTQPFTPAMLREAGEDPRIRGPRFRNLVRGIWVQADAADRTSLVKAAILAQAGPAYASHLTAAELLGLPVPKPQFVHVTVRQQEQRRYRPEIKPHVTDRRQRLVKVRGIDCTDPIATFIDCAGMLNLVEQVVLGDDLVKRYGISPSQLVRACKASTDYYAGLALLAAGYVREGVDSPMESRLRMLIVLAGLPEPQVGFKLWNDDGTWRRRFDLYYESVRLIVEYDGLYHLEPRQKDKDNVRREELDDEGYRILVVTSAGIFKNPLDTLQRIRRQLVARGMQGVPEIDDRWREHFDG
ncbi:DUF559 domain-containing protein [Nocardioides sp. C4-1]|uniref:DUF559 domain-containing protein n=1 Tax=Nocardioides sp. C4-1 TaxID=3151851 RepID=UPI0032673701